MTKKELLLLEDMVMAVDIYNSFYGTVSLSLSSEHPKIFSKAEITQCRDVVIREQIRQAKKNERTRLYIAKKRRFDKNDAR